MDDAQRQEAIAEQRHHWNEVAAGWDRWWPLIEAATAEVNTRLIELAGVPPGARVLDVATGLGEPALSAARRVGPEGRVLGVDLAPGMLASARRRMHEEGIANLELEERDVQDLGLDGVGFDAAVCRFGLMLVHEPVLAARQIRQALAPGARFATAVWGRPAEAPFFALPHRAVAEVLNLPPLPEPDLAGEPGPTRLGDARLLAGVLEEAGFEGVEIERITVRYRFKSVGELLSLLGDISRRLREALDGAPAGSRARFEARLAELVAPHQAADGKLTLDNVVLLAHGAAPA